MARRYVMIRLLEGAITLWAAVTVVFFLAYLLPGDPAQAALAQSSVSQDVLEARREALGLDDPLLVQYGRYLAGLFTGDLGISWASGQQVAVMVAPQIGPTVRLTTAGMVVAIISGLGLGAAAALGSNRWVVAITEGLSGLALGIPVMVSGTVLVWVFAVGLGWLPATGQGDWQRLVMPALVIGFSASGGIAQVVQSGMESVRGEAFTTTAKAKGLTPAAVAVRHVMRVGVLPVLDIIALQAGFLIGGAVVTEILFARQGVGRVLVSAVLNKDLPVIQAVVLLSAGVYVVLNLTADILHAALDPRINLHA